MWHLIRLSICRWRGQQQRVADPFVIAKAAIDGRAVVTMEQLRPNAVKIPNIWQRFRVKCLSLEEFMEVEGWQF
jgi:hypothetical protein